METVLNSKFTIGDKVVDANNNIFIITDFLYSMKYHRWIVKYCYHAERSEREIQLEYFENRFKYYH